MSHIPKASFFHQSLLKTPVIVSSIGLTGAGLVSS